MAEKNGDYVVMDAVPTATAVPVPATLSVIAPSNLAEGYMLDTEVNGQTVKVQVPQGGVKEGQQFNATVISSTVTDQHNIPHGSWRDGLCNCCGQGPCHPSLCLTCWCAPLSLAQVMTRMKLNWCGEQKGAQAASKTFLYILILFGAYVIADAVLDTLMTKYAPTEEEVYGNDGNEEVAIEYSSAWWAIYSVRAAVRLAFFLWFLVVTIRTRQTIRDKYDIPTQQCGGCEDCCCSYWCSCCTIAQMSRHTADYDSYPGSCCTSTGLKANAPQVV